MKSSSKSKSPAAKPADYERFGRYMADVFESGYVNKRRMYKMSFIKGVLTGFGGVLGATVVVGLLLWILSFFDQLPFVDAISNAIDRS